MDSANEAQASVTGGSPHTVVYIGNDIDRDPSRLTTFGPMVDVEVALASESAESQPNTNQKGKQKQQHQVSRSLDPRRLMKDSLTPQLHSAESNPVASSLACCAEDHGF